jgi:hypothetical protein
MPAWLGQTVLGFVLGLAAAVIAAVITAWLRARVEHDLWLRQERLEAFVGFAAALDACVRPRANWQLSWDKPDEGLNRERFHDVLEALERAAGRLHLLSTRDAGNAAIRARDRWRLINGDLEAHDEGRLLQHSKEAGECYQKFIEAAREELGRPRSIFPRRNE